MNNIRGHTGEHKVCGSVRQWVLNPYFVGLVLMFGVFGVLSVSGVFCGGSGVCLVGTCAYATDNVDYSPAHIGESTESICPQGLLVTTRIVLDRNHAQVHISLPPSADTSTFTFEASGRRIMGIEEVRPEEVRPEGVGIDDSGAERGRPEEVWPEDVGPEGRLEGVGPVMIVYFDADAIPNTEKARAHIYKDAPPLVDGEDVESARPVMNMVNLSATFSYVIPDGSGVVKEE